MGETSRVEGKPVCQEELAQTLPNLPGPALNLTFPLPG